MNIDDAYPDYGEDYNSFEKAVVRSIDALEAVAGYLDDFVFDANIGAIDLDAEAVKDIKAQIAECHSLRERLKRWGLGVPRVEVI